MLLVSDLLKSKGSKIYSVRPSDSVYDALKHLAENNLGALLVMEDDHLLGIFSERDYTRKVILENRASKNVLVKDIMTARILYVNPTQTVEECMAIMTQKRVRHLPVMENKKVCGVISIGDVVKATVAEKNFMIDQLTTYLYGPEVNP